MRWRLLGLVAVLTFVWSGRVQIVQDSATIKPQWWVGTIDSAIPTSAADNYVLPQAPESSALGAEIGGRAPMPAAGAVSDLTCSLSGDVGDSGDNLICTLRKAGGDTALTCTITGGAGSETICTLAATPITFAEGDLVSLEMTTEGTPVAVLPRWRMKFTPTTADQFVLLGNNLGASTSAVRYFGAYGFTGGVVTETDRRRLLPLAGTITAIFVATDATYSGTQARTFALMRNTAAEADVTCALNSTNTTACTDTGTITFAAADVFSLRDTPTAGGDSEPLDTRGFGLRFDPTNAGEFFFGGAATASPSTTADRFAAQDAGLHAWNATEANVLAFLPALTFKRLYIVHATAAGTGSSWAWTQRINGADTALTCTTTDPATTCCADVDGAGGCTDVADVASTDGQSASMEVDPNVVPPAAPGSHSYAVAVVAP